jgi:protein TonB
LYPEKQRDMEKPQRKKFLKTPVYPGGSIAFKKFISENLQYPQEALASGIQGSVIVGYDVLDTGRVENIHILKGLSKECDDEAIRLISMLQFEKVKNRGLRLKMTTRTTIHFRLPGVVIQYSAPESSAGKIPSDNSNGNTEGQSYNYTITF